jgi:tripartite-type tricarboxylate transporter receptor subunit TctC
VAKAAPDGYTLLINSSAHTVNPAIFASLPYDTLKDFTDIAALAIQPNVLVVGADSPYKSLADLLAYARANPGKLNFGHAGVGSGTHLNTEKLLAQAGVTATVVPFKGTPEVVAAILSGSVDCYWVPISAGLSHIKSGKLRALAVTTAKRAAALPDVPTLEEAGVKGVDIGTWFGVLAPAATPKDIVARLNTELVKVIRSPEFKKRMDEIGAEPIGNSGEQMAAQIKGETEKFAKLVKEAKVTIE